MLASVVLALALASAPEQAPRPADPTRTTLEVMVLRLFNVPRIVEAIGRFLIVLSHGTARTGEVGSAR